MFGRREIKLYQRWGILLHFNIRYLTISPVDGKTATNFDGFNSKRKISLISSRRDRKILWTQYKLKIEFLLLIELLMSLHNVIGFVLIEVYCLEKNDEMSKMLSTYLLINK